MDAAAGRIRPRLPLYDASAPAYRGGEVINMRAHIGDRILVHGRTVDAADRTGVVIEVRERDGEQLLVVRYDDGHEAVLSPGSDCEIVAGQA